MIVVYKFAKRNLLAIWSLLLQVWTLFLLCSLTVSGIAAHDVFAAIFALSAFHLSLVSLSFSLVCSSAFSPTLSLSTHLTVCVCALSTCCFPPARCGGVRSVMEYFRSDSVNSVNFTEPELPELSGVFGRQLGVSLPVAAGLQAHRAIGYWAQ